MTGRLEEGRGEREIVLRWFGGVSLRVCEVSSTVLMEHRSSCREWSVRACWKDCRDSILSRIKGAGIEPGSLSISPERPEEYSGIPVLDPVIYNSNDKKGRDGWVIRLPVLWSSPPDVCWSLFFGILLWMMGWKKHQNLFLSQKCKLRRMD